MSREQFGNLQGRKMLSGRPGSTGNRFTCTMCQESMISDEALQLHRIWHSIMALTEVVDMKLDEVRAAINRKLEP